MLTTDFIELSTDEIGGLYAVDEITTMGIDLVPNVRRFG
jgi:hypothetical protein